MPMKDGTGPDGKGPKNKNKGVPTPHNKRIDKGRSKADKGSNKGGRGRGMR